MVTGPDDARRCRGGFADSRPAGQGLHPRGTGARRSSCSRTLPHTSTAPPCSSMGAWHGPGARADDDRRHRLACGARRARSESRCATKRARQVTYRDSTSGPTGWPRASSARASTRGDRVATWMTDGFEYVEVYLACAKAGLVVCPINARNTAPEATYLLEDSGAALLVHADSLAEKVAGLPASVVAGCRSCAVTPGTPGPACGSDGPAATTPTGSAPTTPPSSATRAARPAAQGRDPHAPSVPGDRPDEQHVLPARRLPPGGRSPARCRSCPWCPPTCSARCGWAATRPSWATGTRVDLVDVLERGPGHVHLRVRRRASTRWPRPLAGPPERGEPALGPALGRAAPTRPARRADPTSSARGSSRAGA